MNNNISDQLVEVLVDAGIQRIYAVTGDSLNHVNAAVHRNGKIKWIHVRHEEDLEQVIFRKQTQSNS